jgi:hypothetical protein
MDDMIDFLRSKTQLARFSRGEVRDFLDRLDIEGFEIMKKTEMPAVQPMPAIEEPAVEA